MTGSERGRAVRTARRREGLLGPGDGDYTGTPLSEFLTGQFRDRGCICSESDSPTVELDCFVPGILGTNGICGMSGSQDPQNKAVGLGSAIKRERRSRAKRPEDRSPA